MRAELKSVHEKMDNFQTAAEFFNKQYEDLKAVVEEKSAVIEILKEENSTLKSSVLNLTTRLELVEQQQRDCNVEINGVPESRTDNHLTDTIKKIGNTVNFPIADTDILHVTRVAKMDKTSARPRTVIVKFQSTRHRDNFLASVVFFNKKNPKDKLNTRHLGIEGASIPVYVSEHLTPGNKSLHAQARQAAKEKKYKFVWVRSGRIFVRKDEYSQPILVKCPASLAKIK
ncbi:uncharacterized protein LOC106139829 [Amyelois transitella]|uniref:uncharacterized protein LOC106139829 n=1 Tax=Amyelois transitella TaxID=680683 RepID=UPI00067CF986|nr:uncharacterized protein LOC106139829 [Amyelois transitella]